MRPALRDPERAAEVGRELAEALGQIAPEVHPDLGEIRYVSSSSRPGHRYPMVWAPVSGWVHADDSCPAFKECRHRKEASLMTSLVVRDADNLPAGRAVLLVEYDAQAISKGVDPAVAAKWAYDLPGGGGTGVGVRGAEEGVRLLASHGESIRVDDVRLEYQDDREAFFIATASRYVFTDAGVEIKLDSQRRGKRIPKFEQHSPNYMRDHPREPHEYFNKNWYEVGVSKAARNAALALMPSNIKSALLKAGLDAAAAEKAKRPPQQESRRQAPASRQSAPVEGEVIEHGATQQAEARSQGEAVGGTPAESTSPSLRWAEPAAPPPAVCDHEATMDEKTALLTCSKCGVILEEAPPGIKQPALPA